MSKKTLRPAIAMIELIFALVIMGLVLMTAPMLVNTASKSAYVSVQQENINEAASRINMIMGYPWDEGNVENSTFNTILATDSPVSDLNASSRTINITTVEGYRVGTPIESLRNFNAPGNTRYATAVASLGSDGGDKDDIDDFIDTVGLTLEGTGNEADYIEDNVIITTAITYIADAAAYNSTPDITYDFDPSSTPGGSTSIKSITATLTGVAGNPDELDKTIILHAFSCNIGGYKLEEKDVN